MTATKTAGLGERMKRHEGQWKSVLPARTWAVIRVDGKAFHTWTRGMQRPYEPRMLDAMREVTAALCDQTQGAVLGYCQSDEASIVLATFTGKGTPHLGGVIQKLASISASVATATFAREFPNRPPALFDARAFALPSRSEVRNYLLWRQADARRNAVHMLARGEFSHKQLDRVSTADQFMMLNDAGVALDDVDPNFLHGQVLRRVLHTGDVEFVRGDGTQGVAENVERHVWEASSAPGLDCQPGTFLDNYLPVNPDEDRLAAVEEAVELWHAGAPGYEDMPLSQALGWSTDEYAAYVGDGTLPPKRDGSL